MGIDYEINEAGDIIRARPRGVLTVSDTLDYFADLAVDDRLRKGSIEIVYFNEVSDFELTYSQCQSIPGCFDQPKQTRMILATIFVCASGLGFGIGRMLQTLHGIANPDHIVVVVRSEEELAIEIGKLRESSESGFSR